MLERVYYSDPPLTAGTYKIRNENSFKLMVVKGASELEGAEIVQNGTGAENSEWEIVPATFGFVQLRNKKSRKYLVVKKASLEVGEVLIQHSASTPNSYWTISKETYMDSGTKRVVYTLRNQLSELYAVVKNASTADGAPIVQYNTGGKNKLWTFEKQSSNASTRSFDLEQTDIATDFDKPEVMVDCKNDMILLDYPFKSPTELIVRIINSRFLQISRYPIFFYCGIHFCTCIRTIQVYVYGKHKPGMERPYKRGRSVRRQIRHISRCGAKFSSEVCDVPEKSRRKFRQIFFRTNTSG